MEKILRAFAWKMILPFSWARCRTLFLSDNLAPPLETLTPTKAESESDWWKTSLEYFEGKGVQSEAVSKQLEIEKDSLSEVVQKKKRKRGSSPPSFQNPTYEQLMTRVSTLEGTVTTLTQTVSSLQGSIGTLESQLLALEGDARVSTLTQTVSSLQGTIATLESRLLALEGDERDFGVVSDGDIAAYMSPGPSYTSHGPLHTSPASTAHKSLPLANRRKLRVRRTPLKLKSPMRCYLRKSRSCTIPPPPTSTTMPLVTTTKDTHLDDSDVAKDAAKDTHLDDVTTILVPMTTTEKTLKDIIHIDASDITQESGHTHTEDELKIIRIETTTKKPSYDLPDLTKIRRGKYPIFTTFEKKKTDCYLDCLPKGRVCETSFWDILWPGGENVDYVKQGMLDGLVMMRKRPCNAQWTLGHSELVAFYKDSSNLMSMVSVVDVVRATIDGTNPRYPSWEKISQVRRELETEWSTWLSEAENWGWVGLWGGGGGVWGYGGWLGGLGCVWGRDVLRGGGRGDSRRSEWRWVAHGLRDKGINALGDWVESDVDREGIDAYKPWVVGVQWSELELNDKGVVGGLGQSLGIGGDIWCDGWEGLDAANVLWRGGMEVGGVGVSEGSSEEGVGHSLWRSWSGQQLAGGGWRYCWRCFGVREWFHLSATLDIEYFVVVLRGLCWVSELKKLDVTNGGVVSNFGNDVDMLAWGVEASEEIGSLVDALRAGCGR
ncbi:hypothetical protein Tco_0988661 [Tanacetum coccineum]|uniref:Uncharacterized protein n=1 Tax=Tanacetum coccineum TaxID=301880 RepID=A0ABQ5ESW6_9ASTR